MSDLQPSNIVKLQCPYCGHPFEVELPDTIKKTQYTGIPFEIECVAYTRDIGRFDPKEEDNRLPSKGWSRIGKDFFSTITYEKIGILRVDDICTNVCYRVQNCPKCHNLFDAYANYSYRDGNPVHLHRLWPHVFGKVDQASSEIRLYDGESWPFWITGQLSRLVGKSRIAGAFLLSAMLFGFGLIPWLLSRPADHWGVFLVETLLHFVAVISIFLVLVISHRYIKYLSDASDFNETLDVREHRSIHHWLNFSRCRLVGVQDLRGLPEITQVDIFAGGGGVLSLIFTWAVINRNWLVAGSGIFLALIIFLRFVDMQALLKNRFSIESVPRWIKPVIVSVVILAAIIALVIGRKTISWSALNQGIDLIFWIFVAYLLGTGTLFMKSIATYVLITLSKIPMRLNPYNQYKQIKPLRRIQTYSTWTILLLFLTIIFIAGIIITFRNLPIGNIDALNSFRQASIQWNWLVIWMSLALALIFGGLGIGRGKLGFLFLAIVYLILYFFSRNWNPVISFGPININFINPALVIQPVRIPLQGQLIMVGVFLTLLLVQHLISTDQIISDLINATRKKYLDNIDQQIAKVNAHMQRMNDPAEEKSEEYHLKELQKNTKTLNHLLKLRIVVEQSRDRPKFRGLQLVSPIVSSLVFPTILEGVIFPLFN